MSMFQIYETEGGVTCPKCSKHWDRDDLYLYFQSHDYAMSFEIEHEGCDKRLEVVVDSEPVFSRMRENGEKGPNLRRAGGAAI